MPNDTAEWRYTASSQEVVRTDGVLIARDVPEEFGPMVETAPALLNALEAALAFMKLGTLHPGGLFALDALLASMASAIARARP